MRSKSRFTSSALRRGVPLNIMCSRKCDTPETSGVSSRLPVRTKNPTATDRAAGLVSPISCNPLGSLCEWNGMSFPLCVSAIPEDPVEHRRDPTEHEENVDEDVPRGPVVGLAGGHLCP